MVPVTNDVVSFEQPGPGIPTAHLKNENGRVASPGSVPIHLNVNITIIHSLDSSYIYQWKSPPINNGLTV